MLNRYKIEDLPAENLYVVSVMLSVCTETSGCEANHTIFNKLMLPKQPCQWDEGFVNSSLYIELIKLGHSFQLERKCPLLYCNCICNYHLPVTLHFIYLN